MPDTLRATRRNSYLGLLLVSCSTLSLELLLTRIFSVTLWYHFAFMVVSIALFGMTAGALFVFLQPRRFEGHVQSKLAISALLFAITTVLAYLAHLRVPLNFGRSGAPGPGAMLATYILMSVPFFFSGINVTTALTKLPARIGRLYAADLIGAATGCLLFVLFLNATNGHTALFLTALVACLGALSYGWTRNTGSFMRGATWLSNLLLLGVTAALIAFPEASETWAGLRWVKGKEELRPLYERWNSYSRVTIWGDPEEDVPVFGFGYNPSDRPAQLARQLRLAIDAGADTYLTGFDGDLTKVAYLREDVSFIAHELRPGSHVLIIGSGGGRDLLAALNYRQTEIDAVEVNRDIVDLVHGELGDFTGHLDSIPGVTIVSDEARSFVACQDESYDIIQLSLIDTLAASSAGAFVLTEHTLYTVEAWEMLLEHLSPSGVLSISRWYFADLPYETYRLVALASESLRRIGVTAPQENILLVSNIGPDAPEPNRVGISTILVSPSPFTAADLERAVKYAQEKGFIQLYSPEAIGLPIIAEIVASEDLAGLSSTWPESIDPPTDDRPYFFFGVRIRDLLLGRIELASLLPATTNAIYILGVLTISVLGLTLLVFLVPMLLTSWKESFDRTWPYFAYFAAIGFGYLLVEVSQLQRLIIFLGHPTYAVTVLLFTILLASGLGSMVSEECGRWRKVFGPAARLMVLLILLAAYAITSPIVTEKCVSCPTSLRIAVVVVLLFPVGFFMGMPLPIGMRRAAGELAGLMPWLFGLNGTTSVAASVLAVVISLTNGITAAFLIGFACYGIATLVYWIGMKAKAP